MTIPQTFAVIDVMTTEDGTQIAFCRHVLQSEVLATISMPRGTIDRKVFKTDRLLAERNARGDWTFSGSTKASPQP